MWYFFGKKRCFQFKENWDREKEQLNIENLDKKLIVGKMRTDNWRIACTFTQ